MQASLSLPTSVSLKSLALALSIGGGGGYAFWLLQLPLPWMLGAMLAVTCAALAGARPVVAPPLRKGMLAVLGVMLGSNFAPALFSSFYSWMPGLLGLIVFTLLTPFVAAIIFRRLGGHDRVTAYFAAAPGGINEMVSVGGALGGDERTIALVHALRILIVVFTVPVWFRLTGDVAGPSPAPGSSVLDGGFAGADAAILLICAVAGLPVGKLLRFPAWHLTGPMILSAIAHLGGITTLTPPTELVALAQVVVGSALGARFVGTPLVGLGKTAFLALVSSLVMLVLAALIAGIVGLATGQPFILLLLAYVPGGVAEMSLVSLALGMDVAFVATHHLVRIVLVIALAPAVFRLTRRWRDRSS